MQNRPQVAQVEELLREQVGAVALDERRRTLAIRRRRRAARRRSSRSVRLWASQRLSCDSVRSCSASTSIASDGRDVWHEPRFGGRAVGVPTFGRRDERADDRLVAVGEQPVVFGDRARADRVIRLPSPGRCRAAGTFRGSGPSRGSQPSRSSSSWPSVRARTMRRGRPPLPSGT